MREIPKLEEKLALTKDTAQSLQRNYMKFQCHLGPSEKKQGDGIYPAKRAKPLLVYFYFYIIIIVPTIE